MSSPSANSVLIGQAIPFKDLVGADLGRLIDASEEVTFTTGDEKFDMEHKEIIISTLDLHTNISREDLEKMLQEIRS
jgi:hypothetical protein